MVTFEREITKQEVPSCEEPNPEVLVAGASLANVGRALGLTVLRPFRDPDVPFNITVQSNPDLREVEITRREGATRGELGQTCEPSEAQLGTRQPRSVTRMYAIYEAGSTLEGVAKKFGITRERVRQLFKKTGLRTRSIAAARAEQRKRELARRDEILSAHKRLGDPRAVAKELAVTQKCVALVLKETQPRVQRHKKRRPSSKFYSTEELIACLRDASEALGGILSVAAYRAYAAGRSPAGHRPWPSPQTIELRFGGWRRALVVAGLRANPSSPIAGRRLFNEAHCIDALRHAARELGESPTVSAYEKLARKSQGALPSQCTIRHRLGSWLEALRKAGLP